MSRLGGGEGLQPRPPLGGIPPSGRRSPVEVRERLGREGHGLGRYLVALFLTLMGVEAAVAGLFRPALGVAIMLGISVAPPTVGLARRFLLSVLLRVAVLFAMLAAWNLARVVLSPGLALAGVVAVLGGASVAG